MLKARLVRWLKPLAILAICLQSLMPTAMAYASASNGDLARLLCNASGAQLSSETAASLQALMDVLDGDEDQTPPMDGSCAFCTLAHAAPLPESDALSVKYRVSQLSSFGLFETEQIRSTRGPPVGLRAPPHPNC